MPPLLGCIADDFTGATDLASALVEGGMRAVLVFGTGLSRSIPTDVDAVVVALKSRSIPAEEAAAVSLSALRQLKEFGARKFYFKYCSTFDSTDAGNIGPVAEALLGACGAEQTVFCPAFPENGRTVYQGQLFVGDRLLNQSGMEHHPLNPMTDANLVRVLQRQSKRNVGLVAHESVRRGAGEICKRLSSLRSEDISLAIIDAVSRTDLEHAAQAVAEMDLVTGSAGLGFHLPAAYRNRGLLEAVPTLPPPPDVKGRTAILSGSCSQASQRQVAACRETFPNFEIDVQRAVQNRTLAGDVLDWIDAQRRDVPLLIYSTTSPAALRCAQEQYGADVAARAIEQTMATVAQRLAERGFRRFIVAGGETSGAVVQALGVTGLRIGPVIDPGVPWTESLGDPTLALALKSGNFGGDNFFIKALEMLP